VLELKEAAECRAQKNAIRLKELELQEKRHAAKVRKMEMDAEIQKVHLKHAKQHGKHVHFRVDGCSRWNSCRGSSRIRIITQLGGSMTTESWVHTQQQASTSSSSSSESGQMSALPGAMFNFSANDFHFSGSN